MPIRVRDAQRADPQAGEETRGPWVLAGRYALVRRSAREVTPSLAYERNR
jgi:hypothetical protein